MTFGLGIDLNDSLKPLEFGLSRAFLLPRRIPMSSVAMINATPAREPTTAPAVNPALLPFPLSESELPLLASVPVVVSEVGRVGSDAVFVVKVAADSVIISESAVVLEVSESTVVLSFSESEVVVIPTELVVVMMVLEATEVVVGAFDSVTM